MNSRSRLAAVAAPLSWDDYRFLLAIGRAGSLNGAAKRLGVSHPTVFRRVNAIERALGVRLFERAREGYAPTPNGEEAIAAAAQIEERIAATERRLAGLDARPTGTVRLATVEPLLHRVLPPLLARFRRAHPGIVVQVTADNHTQDLSRHEADLALRPGGEPPEGLVGRKLARLASAVYRPRALRLPRGAGPQDLDGYDWLLPAGNLAHIAMAQWLRRMQYDRRAVFSANSLLGLREAAVAGLGLTVLPCYLGDGERGLVRVGDPVEAMGADLWLLQHPDLRRTERVRALAEALREGVRALQPDLSGRAGPIG
ncbi:LysR family transcriptional regulator [Lysobacter enzymogenes]|uniref:LysR family transcriptional regulator n=1 Tax=Lysobacter enzymogenes TaxID=69 RepID=UPI001AF91C8D|nr:LysR family transcriptional regulator [Lysobacter enzymogenes]QQQ02065.1 LysR family transcriptional regulator [Lysobacter enzymogenes]